MGQGPVRAALAALAWLVVEIAVGQGRARAEANDGGGGARDGGADVGTDRGGDAAGSVDGGAGDGAIEARPAATAATPAPVLAPTPPVPLRGTVFARGGHHKVKRATILIDGTIVGEADAEGAFAVEGTPGRHHLQATAPGFEPGDIVVDVSASGWSGALRLSPGGGVYETVVAARQPGAAVKLAGEEARTTPGTGGDPFRVIESLPGVSQIVWPFAVYAIRGANPGNTGFFLDGMRVPALFHFALGPSIVHPYLVGKLTFYPGGYPARLGSYVSGAVAAETAPPPNDASRYSADVRLYDAGGLAAAPWDGGRGTVAVAARYSFTGLIVSHLFSEVSFGYADYQLRADHTFAGGRLTLLAIGSFDSIDIQGSPIDSVSGTAIGDASVSFHRVDLRWERAIAGGRLLARTSLAYDDAHSELYDSPIAERALSIAPRVAYTHPVGAVGAVEVGLDGEGARYRTDAVVSPSTPPLGDLALPRRALTTGAYVAAILGGKRFGVEPGLRYAFYAEQGTTRGAFEPRLAARAGLTPRLSVDATVGRFSQMPSLPLGVAGFEAFGLRDFGLQTSTQTALSVEARVLGESTLRLTGFYQWLYVSDVRSTFARNVGDPEFLEMRPGRGYGAELMFRLPDAARVHGWLAYTLSWSERDFAGIYAPSDWDQRHILNLVATTRLTRAWSLGGRFHFNTGRPYPVQTEAGGEEYHRLPDFWQLDLRVDRRFLLDRMLVDLYLELGNVTLTREVVGLRRERDLGPPSEVGFRIVLPSIGVHIEW